VADLLRAAQHLFATEGYTATTMSAIATLAGASVGSLYQFFPDKKSIGSALLLGYSEELGLQLEAWKGNLPKTPRVFGQELIAVVFDYVSHRPACTVLAQTPSLVPESSRMETFSRSIQNLLAVYAPAMPPEELATVAFAASFIVRGALQGGRMVDEAKGAALRAETQQALGMYLEARLAG
jgi:AcrR family transcriptional regulator